MTYIWGMDRKNNTLTAHSSLYFALESIIPPGQAYWHDPNKHMPDTDWDIAWQILQDVGYYVNVTDNRLYNPDGTQVRDIDVECSASTFWGDIAGDFVASANGFFEYIGATTGPAFRLLELDFMTLIYKLTVYHDFDIICLGYDGLGKNPDWLYDAFHSRDVWWYPTNYGGFDHPEADELLETIMFSQNVTEIKEACYEFQHLFNEWYPWFPVCSKYMIHTYDSGLMNFIESPGFSSNNAWTWRMMHWNTSASGGSVRCALADEPDAFNPLYGNKGAWEIMDRIFDDLLELNPETHDHVPWQACNWIIECGSWPELGILHGKKISLRLRNDMYWHDSGAYKDLNDNDELDPGEPIYIFPVTSKDVKFAWDFLKKYQPSKFSEAWRSIVYVETDGPWGVTAYLNATTIWGLNDLTDSAKVLPKHIWKKVDEKIENGEWETPEDFHPWEISYEEWTGLTPPPQYPFMKALIGDGSFVFDYYDDSTRRGQVHSNDVYWVDGPIKCAVDAQYIVFVDKDTECIPDPIEYNVVVSNYGYRKDGELANKTVDVKIYEEDIVTQCETDVQVNILSEYDNSQLYSIKLLEVWPMNVGALNFAYDTRDTPATLTVTFAYRKWIKNEKGPREGSLAAASGTGSVSRTPSVIVGQPS